MAKASNNSNTALKIGAGLAAAGAAAAGYYFYGSSKAKDHRKIAAKWATDMKKDVVAQTRHLEKATPQAFNSIVDSIAKTYAIARSVDTAELKRAAKELKANWDLIQGEAKRGARKSGRVAQKSLSSAKKSVKRVAKRAA